MANKGLVITLFFGLGLGAGAFGWFYVTAKFSSSSSSHQDTPSLAQSDASPAKAEAEAPGSEDTPKERILIPPPLSKAPQLQKPHRDPADEAIPAQYTHAARSRWHEAPIYRDPSEKSPIVGRVRTGNHVAVQPAGRNAACRRGSVSGSWHAVYGGGFVCSASEFVVVDKPLYQVANTDSADYSLALPFRYARVTTEAAPRFARLPNEKELTLVSAGNAPKGLVAEYMRGDFFLAFDLSPRTVGTGLYRTLSGEYVTAAHVEMRDAPTFFGERLEKDSGLPLAFVFGDDEYELYCVDGANVDDLKPCGKARKHARFAFEGLFKHDGVEWVLGPEGIALPRSAVRIVQAIDKPNGIPQGGKWLHVDVEHQTLVAYEDDTPVYATLVSTGTTGYETPEGLYRTYDKHVSKTMRGKDQESAIYHVEEVPWILYYLRRYAVHGAYWHNDFGKSRSHGCTNLSPIDAQWIYHWENLQLPPGWHAVLGEEGSWLYFTKNVRKRLSAADFAQLQ